MVNLARSAGAREGRRRHLGAMASRRGRQAQRRCRGIRHADAQLHRCTRLCGYGSRLALPLWAL